MSSISAERGSFNIGEVIATGFQTLNRGWIKLISLTVLPWLLAYALVLGGVSGGSMVAGMSTGPVTVDSAGGATVHWGVFAMIFGLFAVIGILYVVCQAALIYGVVEQLGGRAYSFGGAVSVGLSRVGRMIGIALVLIAAYLCFIAVIMLLGAIIPPLLFIAVPALFFIAGPMLACAFFVLFPVASVEDHGIIGSFTRSRFLTKGYRWPIFGLILILFLGMAAINIVVAYVVQAALPTIAAALANLLIGVWLSTLFSVIIAVAYFRLRYLKEGVSVDQIASVFD